VVVLCSSSQPHGPTKVMGDKTNHEAQEPNGHRHAIPISRTRGRYSKTIRIKVELVKMNKKRAEYPINKFLNKNPTR